MQDIPRVGLLLPDQRFDDELRLVLRRRAEREDHLGQAVGRHAEVHHRVRCHDRRAADIRQRARPVTPAQEESMTIENGAARAHASPWTVESAQELYAVRAWGDAFFFVNDAGPCGRAAVARQRPVDRHCRGGRGRCRARRRTAGADPLPGRAARAGAPAERSVRRGHRRRELRQSVPGDLSDQGQPAARGRRGGARRRQAVRHGPRVRLEERS